MNNKQSSKSNNTPSQSVAPVVIQMATDNSSLQRPSSRVVTPAFHYDYYTCTNCHAYACGRTYSSLCEKCNGVIADPPRQVRYQYLCHDCARRRHACTCDHPRVLPPTSPSPKFSFRNPPEYCWSSCCTCLTCTCSCTCCNFFCECLSASCERYDPCCYCTRPCGEKRLCFWSWFPCSCSPP